MFFQINVFYWLFGTSIQCTLSYCLPFLPDPPFHSCDPPPRSKNHTKLNLCCSYTQWSMAKLLVDKLLLKITEFFPLSLSRRHQLWRATLQQLYHVIRTLFNGFQSRLFLFGRILGVGRLSKKLWMYLILNYESAIIGRYHCRRSFLERNSQQQCMNH